MTRAADRLYVSQPAMSGMLQRLRDQFDDLLLVKVGREMEITPKGAVLQARVREVLVNLRDLLESDVSFDPGTARRHFRIAMFDHCGEVFLPLLARLFSERGPSLQIWTENIGSDTVERLAAGDVDLCITTDDARLMGRGRTGYGLNTRILFGDEYVCVAWDGHRAIGETLSLEVFKASHHAQTKFHSHTMTIEENAFRKAPVVSAPDPLNAPNHVGRLNQHRKRRLRARPKTIAHVVFAIPDFEQGYTFMRERLGFRLSDHQEGVGMYLRADGSNNHHSLLLLNASAPFPDMDGKHRFHHANFAVEDVDEVMVGANHMVRAGWEPSHQGLGRHRIDSALFYYIPCPAGGEAEYGADSDYVDDGWVPRHWPKPLFAYAHFVHNLPPFLMDEPEWTFAYITEDGAIRASAPAAAAPSAH